MLCVSRCVWCVWYNHLLVASSLPLGVMPASLKFCPPCFRGARAARLLRVRTPGWAKFQVCRRRAPMQQQRKRTPSQYIGRCTHRNQRRVSFWPRLNFVFACVCQVSKDSGVSRALLRCTTRSYTSYGYYMCYITSKMKNKVFSWIASCFSLERFTTFIFK